MAIQGERNTSLCVSPYADLNIFLRNIMPYLRVFVLLILERKDVVNQIAKGRDWP
jgi:hypothetical protein